MNGDWLAGRAAFEHGFGIWACPWPEGQRRTDWLAGWEDANKSGLFTYLGDDDDS